MFRKIFKYLCGMINMAERRFYRQIVIRYISEPAPAAEANTDADIDWLYQCLGLGDERDQIGRLVFRALVKSGRTGISSRDIMQLGHMTQAAVIYHLNLFQRSGLVVRDGRNYYLRGYTLTNALEEMETDMQRRFDFLKKIAKKIEQG